MIKGFSLKRKESSSSSISSAGSYTNAAILRLQKDLAELTLPPSVKLEFKDPDDLMNFVICIKPQEGFYKDGHFRFAAKVNSLYPHEPPKITCVQKIFHPNIEVNGAVCLNILREDWNPVLSLNSVIIGLQLLFTEPSIDDPLNKEAAELLKNNCLSFQKTVRLTMKGASYNQKEYDCVL